MAATDETTAPDPIAEQESCCIDLHCHSEYSALDGGAQVADMSAKLASLNRKAMALTDHGVMQGLPQFYNTLRDNGIKPILGMEAYLTNDRHDKSKDTPTWHLTLLAETTEGYHNLCKVSSFAFIDGNHPVFGRPRARADWDLLSQYPEGIICLTGCMASPVMGSIFEGSLSKAREYTERLVGIYGADNVYGELQDVGITVGIPADSEVAQVLGKQPLSADEASRYAEVEAGEVPLSQNEANHVLVDSICKPLGLKYTYTGDTHYLDEEDANPHDIMLCIGTGQLKKGARRFSLLPKKYNMRDDATLKKVFADWPEALEESKRIGLRCNAEIVFGKELLPQYPLPEEFKNSGEYLRHLCIEGLEERYPEGHELREDALERLDMELGVIASMGFNDYFIITWDLFAEANRRGIPSGPGRGSAAGAIVAYCLDITKICPLEHDLLFERFLNPERRSMPDIDMDFGERGRKELMRYAADKYNELAGCETAVAQIVTFQRYKAKNAIKDAARVLGEPTEEGKKDAMRQGDKMSALVPDDPKVTMGSLWDGKHKEEGKQLRAVHAKGGFGKEVLDQANWLEGMVKTYGIHAAAVIISSHDMTDDLPLQRFGSDPVKYPLHTQYDMGYCEALGLLKMDFLGLKNLDIIWDCCEKIRHTRGVDIEPYKIPLDDTKTYELFARGDTIGTFQFESGGMRSSLQEVRPTEFNDLVALVALYRPGAMTHIPTYAARKHGQEEVAYLDPRLEDIQGNTYGVTIYQEQSMLISRVLAGFSRSEADDLRKAIGKKLHDKMALLKPKYLKGCQDNNVPKEVAEALWADNEAAADYSFNKSHAACYALISYITGYLKANYPHEYMAALLTSAMGDKDKPRLYLTEAKRMGLDVKPPDVNRSLRDFAVVEDEDHPGQHDIVFGLEAIRGVGGGVVSDIKDERERHGPFTSIFDVIRRMPGLTKTVIQALVRAGALDFTSARRKAMDEVVEDAQKAIKKEREAEAKAFVNAVKDRIEQAAQRAASAPDEQQTLGGLDEAFADAVGGEPLKVSKDNKLTTREKRGLEGAARCVWDAKLVIDEAAVSDAVEDKLRKETLRLARKSAKETIKADDEVAGIAAEESAGDSLKDRVEAAAQAEVASQAVDIKAETVAQMEKFMPHLRDEVAAREETADMEAALADDTDPDLPTEDWPRIEMLNIERKMLGIYVTGHPLDEDAEKWRLYVNEGTERGRECGQVTDSDIGETVIVAGAVIGKQAIKMRSGETMYRVALEDLSGSQEVTIFPRTLEGGLEELLVEGEIICLQAAVEEDTFQKEKAAANDEDNGDSEEEGSRPIKLIASRLYRWDASKITDEFVAKARKRAAEREAAEESSENGTTVGTVARGAVIGTIAPTTVSADEAVTEDKAVAEAREAAPAEPKPEANPEPQPVRVAIRPELFNPEWVKRLEALCSAHPGDHPVKLVLDERTFRTKIAVAPNPALAEGIKALLEQPTDDVSPDGEPAPAAA